MDSHRLVSGLAVVLGGITVVMATLGIVFSPAILPVAVLFGVSTYLVYFHASGRLAASVYRAVERRAARNGTRVHQRRTQRVGGFGAGPREAWNPPRDGPTPREDGFGGRTRRQRRVRHGQAGDPQRPPRRPGDPNLLELYRTLDLEPGADEREIRNAYREKVKEVHPDANGGNEKQFKQVKTAYERLTD